MKFLTTFIVLLFTTLSVSVAVAQTKIGYADTETILNRLPDLKNVNQSLQTYQKNLEEKLQVKNSYAQQKLQEYTELKQAGQLPADKEKLAQEDLQRLDQEIQAYAKEAQQKMTTKRSELMQPILKKVQDNIDKLGKKYNLTCIFNTVNNAGVSTLLHAPDKNDLTPLLLKELGIEVKIEAYEPVETKGMVGYTNIEFLLAKNPEAAQVSKTLATYQEQQVAKLKIKENYAQAKLEEYREKKEAKQLTEEQEKTYVATLNSLDKEIKEFSAKASEKMGFKRAELMNPLIKKIETALKDIAKEKGYAYILNQTTSSGLSSVLFGPEENDITAYTLQKIGAAGTENAVNTPKKGEKMGFVNVESVLAAMPEIKSAQEAINQKTEDLLKPILAKEQTYKTKVELYYSKEKAKQFGEGEQEKLVAEIQGLEKDIQGERQSGEQALEKYKLELMTPVLKKLQVAIDEVAKEGKFNFIQNITSGMNLLYIKEGLNVTPALAKKVGVK
ncbi:MAG: OmpH family outer membrane protein [Aureispira sp.]|nr:OmpH family outer membrane protein [Aureispira sp.]